MEKYNVLLVDDEPNILKALVRVLRNDNVNLHVAESAEAALQIVRAKTIQLIIADNLMPGMTGVELVSQIKLVSPNTLRIILSGHSDLDTVLQAVNEGEVFRFILKPWNDQDLKATVSIALAHYRLASENERLKEALESQTRVVSNLRALFPNEVERACREQAVGRTTVYTEESH